MPISDQDKLIIRDLARQVAEIASLPVQKEKADMWRRHNSLQRSRPLVMTFLEDGAVWPDMLSEADLQTSDPLCRGHELALRKVLFAWEHFRDDKVIDGAITSPIFVSDTGWSFGIASTHPDDPLGACSYDGTIKTEADIDLIKMPQVNVDWEGTERHYEMLCDLFDGILKVEKRGAMGFWFSIFDEFVTMRGLEQAFLDMVDRPQWLHEFMEKMTQGVLSRIDQLQALGALSLNNGPNFVGSGGLGCTDELPQPDFDGTHVRPIDMWGHATTQIFSEVSPAMHDEFALRYEGRFGKRFGLMCYGCCEPLDRKIDIISRALPNLRRISMSPWVDVARGAEALQDKFIFSYKPNPAVVAGEGFDAERVRKDLREKLELTRGCVIELILKDVRSCRHQPQRIIEWTKIAMELAEEFA
jgi:hypothetical protein